MNLKTTRNHLTQYARLYYLIVVGLLGRESTAFALTTSDSGKTWKQQQITAFQPRVSRVITYKPLRNENPAARYIRFHFLGHSFQGCQRSCYITYSLVLKFITSVCKSPIGIYLNKAKTVKNIEGKLNLPLFTHDIDEPLTAISGEALTSTDSEYTRRRPQNRSHLQNKKWIQRNFQRRRTELTAGQIQKMAVVHRKC